MAKANPTTLADQAFEAPIANDHGQFDELIAVLAPALGQTGWSTSNRLVKASAEKDRVKIGWPSSSGQIYVDEMAERSWVSVRLALQDIADAHGDVDAFIELHVNEARKVPKIAAEIARRLLSAGRARRHGRRSRGPSIDDAIVVGIGLTSNGKMPAV